MEQQTLIKGCKDKEHMSDSLSKMHHVFYHEECNTDKEKYHNKREDVLM